MSTYTLEGLADFIFKLFDEKNEEDLWEMWLHKERELGFKEFKNKYKKKSNIKRYKSISKEEEEALIESAAKFIKPLNKEGGE